MSRTDMPTDTFSLTATEVARSAGLIAETVRKYADGGLLAYIRMHNGTRLFKPDAVEQARAICKERLANRGYRKAA